MRIGTYIHTVHTVHEWIMHTKCTAHSIQYTINCTSYCKRGWRNGGLTNRTLWKTMKEFQWCVNCKSHKSRNRGWTSADRSTKATLMLTVPRSLIKSSTKDLTWPSLEIIFRHTYTFKVQRCQGVVLIQDYCYSGNSGQGGYQPCQHGFWLRGVQS